jgi:hypothetical protein
MTQVESHPSDLLVVSRAYDLPVSARSMGTLGEKLREAREGSNRTIKELSEQTKIRTDHLEAWRKGTTRFFRRPFTFGDSFAVMLARSE